MENIKAMSIKAGNGTCVVLKKRERQVISDGGERIETPVLSLCTVDIDYDDGKKMVFYVEDYTLLEFIRESINQQRFKTHNGERIPLI